MSRKILIVEDETEIARLILSHLPDINCTGDMAGDGAKALALLDENQYDLIILDLMLPDIDGLTLCRQIRQKADYIPILMLTAKTTELDRVLGLEMGADDYLTKPFSLVELLARLKALLRRVEAMSRTQKAVVEDEVITYQDLHIDVSRHQVTLKDAPLDLTAREFDLLLYFARHPGRVFTRLQLLDKVWGYNHEGYEHTVNSHINRLRAKVEEDPAKPRYVLTVWGVGYKFAESESVQ